MRVLFFIGFKSPLNPHRIISRLFQGQKDLFIWFLSVQTCVTALNLSQSSEDVSVFLLQSAAWTSTTNARRKSPTCVASTRSWWRKLWPSSRSSSRSGGERQERRGLLSEKPRFSVGLIPSQAKTGRESEVYVREGPVGIGQPGVVRAPSGLVMGLPASAMPATKGKNAPTNFPRSVPAAGAADPLGSADVQGVAWEGPVSEAETEEPLYAVPKKDHQLKFAIEDFVLHKMLGKGSFGKVRQKTRLLVQHSVSLPRVSVFTHTEVNTGFLSPWRRAFFPSFAPVGRIHQVAELESFELQQNICSLPFWPFDWNSAHFQNAPPIINHIAVKVYDVSNIPPFFSLLLLGPVQQKKKKKYTNIINLNEV